jgi:hypothetical protein
MMASSLCRTHRPHTPDHVGKDRVVRLNGQLGHDHDGLLNQGQGLEQRLKVSLLYRKQSTVIPGNNPFIGTAAMARGPNTKRQYMSE